MNYDLPTIECQEILDMVKSGYPNQDTNFNIKRPYDVGKWIEAVKQIYSLKRDGLEQQEALKRVTSQWVDTETVDFLHWLKFYQSGSHMKYSFAQSWYQGNSNGYYLPMKQETPSSFDDAKDQGEAELTSSEKAEISMAQRKKIVSRLDAIEKLIRSERGEIMAGDEHDKLLDSVYTLKKQINALKRKTAAVEVLDMIEKEASVLASQNLYTAASFLKIAVSDSKTENEPPNTSAAPVVPPTEPKPEVSIGTGPDPKSPPPMPTPAQPPPPNKGSGNSVGFPTSSPPASAPSSNVINPAPPSASQKSEQNAGLDQFLENLSTNGLTDNSSADDLQVDDSLYVDDELFVEDNTDPEYSSSELVAKAQAVPFSQPEQPISPPAAPLEKSPVSDATPKEETDDAEGKELKDFDSIIDAAFSTITVADVVKRLESIANVYRTRELSRQLSIIDLMLDRLGVAPLLSSMTEVINRSLDSSNYILTRLEDILGKLRGTMSTNELDLSNPNTSPAASTPEALALKAKLEKDLENDEKKKQMRKEVEDRATEQAIVGDQTPNVSLDEAPPAAPKPPMPAV
jgi:hypothetical protein